MGIFKEKKNKYNKVVIISIACIIIYLLGFWIYHINKVEILINNLDKDSSPKIENSKEKLIKLGNTSIKPIKEAIKNKKLKNKHAGIEILGELNQGELIIELIDFFDVDEKKEAIETLGIIKEYKALDLIISYLDNDDLKDESYKSIINIGDISNDKLIQATESKSIDIVSNSIRLLFDLKYQNDIKPIILAYEKEGENFDEDTKISCIKFFGNSQDKNAIKHLYDMLADSNSDIRYEAIKSISNLDKDNITIDPIIKASKDSNLEVKKISLLILCDTKNEKCADVLINELGNLEDKSINESIVNSLIEYENKYVDELVELLKEGNHNEKYYAAYTLEILEKYSIDSVLKLLNYSDEKVQDYSMEILSNIGKLAFNSLKKAMSSSDYTMKMNAIYSLIQNQYGYEYFYKFLKNKDLANIAKYYEYYICLGERFSEMTLYSALETYGNYKMANDFYNSGNIFLEVNSTAWFLSHGYQPVKSDIDTPQWGKKP